MLFGTFTEIQDVGDNILVEVMKPADLGCPNLFNYPPDDASIQAMKTDVLPLIPVFSLNVNFSARTNPVWELENFEAFKSLTSSL